MQSFFKKRSFCVYPYSTDLFRGLLHKQQASFAIWASEVSKNSLKKTAVLSSCVFKSLKDGSSVPEISDA